MKFKVSLLSFMLMCAVALAQKGKSYQVKSPDGNISIGVNVGAMVDWSVKHVDTEVILPSKISMTLDNGEVLGKNPMVSKTLAASSNTVIQTPVYKKASVRDNYNQLIIKFKGDYDLIFRAYNDGAAYRFVTHKKDELTIINEGVNFNFKDDDKAFLPFVEDYRNKDKFNTSFESHYDNISLSAIKKDTLAFLPVLVDLGSPKKAVILEADLQDYPGMYLTPGAGNNLHGVFAPYPTQEAVKNINYVVNGRANYIAKTKGSRSFPWRVVVVSTEDKQLADNDMMQKLAGPSHITDYSWIKPGKVAWDWWNDWNISKVDFKAGINTETYKYYIDFAARNNLEYVILDEGWSEETNMLKISPQINLEEIISYAKQKNVGIILWASWYAINKVLDDAFSKYSQMGVKGFKIDFIDRDDQKMVSSLHYIAKKAADYKLLIDYHGMYKPAGLQRTYPNILNFEGVKGLENAKWTPNDDMPRYETTIPFIRMLAGPMDYTPGGFLNVKKSDFRKGSPTQVMNSRCAELAKFVIYESPFMVYCDAPENILGKPGADFLNNMPTVWDDTKVLGGYPGQYVIIAKRSGKDWYIGAMTNDFERTVQLKMDFLPAGNYTLSSWSDVLSSPQDLTRSEKKISANSVINVHMDTAGGWAAKITAQ